MTLNNVCIISNKYINYKNITKPSNPSTGQGTYLYSKSGELYVLDESGNETILSPHNKEGDWIYRSKNTKTGKGILINMEELIQDLEKFLDKKYIYNI
jgi:hypothetical protein